MRKSVFFDEESQKHLEFLDKKMNLKPNHSAVIRLALKKLYEEESKPKPVFKQTSQGKSLSYIHEEE